MKNNLVITLFIFSLFVSCSEPEARRPITASKSYSLASTTKDLKKINQLEQAKVLAYIGKDSGSTYLSSPNGFWYQYLEKIELDLPKPKIGDLVEISYEIFDLNNQKIYSKEELGIKNYKVDKEDFIPALQQGIKMMKKGETIKFVIPSLNAFGLVGDNNKIGINKSIISIVTLINIKENIE